MPRGVIIRLRWWNCEERPAALDTLAAPGAWTPDRARGGAAAGGLDAHGASRHGGAQRRWCPGICNARSAGRVAARRGLADAGAGPRRSGVTGPPDVTAASDRRRAAG